MNTEDVVLKGVILSESLIGREQLAKLEEETEWTGHSFADLLIEHEIITKGRLLEIIASYLGTAVLDLQNIDIEKSVVNLLQPIQARTYGALPIGYDSDGILKVALSNPLDYQISEDLSFITSKNIKVCVAPQG